MIPEKYFINYNWQCYKDGILYIDDPRIHLQESHIDLLVTKESKNEKVKSYEFFIPDKNIRIVATRSIFSNLNKNKFENE